MKLFRKSGKLVILSVMVFILGLCTISIASQQQAPAATEVKPPTVIEQKMQQKITLNYRDVPIDDILRAISEQVDLNIVKSPEITKTVTVSVTQVPLGEALNQILSAYDCGYVASENIIRVVPASQLTQETEKTVSKIYRVWYANVKEVEAAITKILTKRGTIAASIGTSNIIVTDTETNIKAIDNFLEEIDRPTPLIMVEVRIYDIKNTNALDIGVEWFAGRNTGFGTQATGGPIVGSSNANPYINGNFESTTKKVGSTGVLDWGMITEHMDIETVFTAIQQQDAAKLLANPRIMVLDNETASFKAIEEIPYQQLQQGGYQSYGTTEFKPVGVNLKVTPHLAKDGMIRLHIVPEFSVHVSNVTLSLTGTSVTMPQPVVDKRKADTIALVKDSQTVVVGGLRKNEVTQEISKVPLLGDIPILGWLFRFQGEKNVQSELVVFITPRILEQPVLTDKEAEYLKKSDVESPEQIDQMIKPAKEAPVEEEK